MDYCLGRNMECHILNVQKLRTEYLLMSNCTVVYTIGTNDTAMSLRCTIMVKRNKLFQIVIQRNKVKFSLEHI